MYFRCVSCRSSTWIPTLESGELAPSVTCKKCAREYDLAKAGQKDGGGAERHAETLKFADDNGIDMASAYAVSLGFMTLSEAQSRSSVPRRATRRAAAKPKPPASDAPETAAAGAATGYDPAFEPAVSEGRLTAEQASERGNREVWASRIATRNGIPQVLAYQVADNEITVKEAVQQVRLARRDSKSGAEVRERSSARSKPRRSRPTEDRARRTSAGNRTGIPGAESRIGSARRPGPNVPPTREPMSGSRKTIAGTAIAIALLGLGLYCRDLWVRTMHRAPDPPVASQSTTERPPRPSSDEPRAGRDGTNPGTPEVSDGEVRSVAVDGAEVSRDADGRVLMVAGPDPSAVLLAFCSAGPGQGRFEPIELTPAIPPFPGTKLGIMRDPAERNTRYAINIRRDRRTRQWVAGNGQQPIAATVAPLMPPGTPRVPVGGP